MRGPVKIASESKQRFMIRLSSCHLEEDEKALARKAMDDEMLGMGLYVQQFEKSLDEFIGREVIAVSSGTAALHLACEAIKRFRPEKNEVIVPSITYVACFQAIKCAGLIPVPCDIDLETGSICQKDLERKISPNTIGIMVVHYSGNPSANSFVYQIAAEKGIRVIEDAAHSFGSKYSDKVVGAVGDIVCFSFDGIKNITCGEGGAVVTSDPEVKRFVKSARLLGVDGDTSKRYSGDRSWSVSVEDLGWRYHMNNISAAIGIGQMSRITAMFKKRQELAHAYVSTILSSRSLGDVSLSPKCATSGLPMQTKSHL